MLRLDHLAVAATSLAEGVAFVEEQLGITLASGGQHPLMATHNRLLGLGDIYLEVIAIDPEAHPPAHPRWFDLDHFTGQPRLTNWIVATDDLDAALNTMPTGAGTPVSLARGDLRWRMAVPANGCLPYDDAFPALIEWEGEAHPASLLPESGIRLTRLEITHPDIESLRHLFTNQLTDPRVQLHYGPQKALCASFATPSGERWLEG